MGLSFTKRESKLQNEILIYKTGLSDYKWDSRVAIHLSSFKIPLRFPKNNINLSKNNKNILTFSCANDMVMSEIGK